MSVETELIAQKRRISPIEAAVAIAFNVVPIVGVLFWGWSAFALLFLFWLENVVIGAFNVLRMLTTGVAGSGLLGSTAALALSAFFTVHYGMFCFGHGVFVLSMFSGDVASHIDSPFDFAGMVGLFQSQPGLIAGLASIVLWQATLFVMFVLRGGPKRSSLIALMGEPYPRMVVLHVTIIFGAMFVLALNEPLWGVVTLALFKTAFDLGAWWNTEPVKDGEIAVGPWRFKSKQASSPQD